ncbi:MAG TPA: bifunctional adenosylcobinamide kinase/adenosylcobinamide-phosphate guanylyltransferase [Fibrobacteraceae bacterium]|nr:bifunctional adenosylcobinamide kinase/adenosylcobinamide-phosphate guanylyltransferase [Fibrobacteraceae bacterium]
MGQIILVTGGTRSGKSQFAESLCLAQPGPHYYLATCPRIPGDPDLDARILAHQDRRTGQGWITLEEPLHLENALETIQTQKGSVLLECLGLWISNLIFAGIPDRLHAESDLKKRVTQLCNTWRTHPGTLVVVAQEAGLGILPAERETRLWLDLLGSARNQFAMLADSVWLVASGIPLSLKGNPNDSSNDP